MEYRNGKFYVAGVEMAMTLIPLNVFCVKGSTIREIESFIDAKNMDCYKKLKSIQFILDEIKNQVK